MSIRDQLTRLAELQAAELEALRLEEKLAALPGERELLQARLEAARSAVGAAEGDREESLKARRLFEGKLQEAEAKIDRYREQEMLVRTNEQLWAIQAEIKTVQDAIDGLEERILEGMERADERAGQIEERKTALQVVEKEVGEALTVVDAEQARLQSEHDAKQSHIDELRGAVGEDLLSVYDRIKAARGGIGLAEIQGENCAACHVRLRPQLVLEVVNMERPLQCDNCKRLLVSREALELPSTVQVSPAG